MKFNLPVTDDKETAQAALNAKEKIMDEAVIKINYYDLEDVVALLAQNGYCFELFTHTDKSGWLPSDWESSSC